jgi:cell shape-determining protein MreC
MMTYLKTTSRPRERRNRTLLGVGISVLIVVMIVHFFMPQFIPGIVTSLIRPFWRLEFAIHSGALRSEEALLVHNEELSRELADAEVRLETIRAIELENSELKGLLGRPLTASSTDVSHNDGRVLAAVLERPPFAPYDELVIDIGTDLGMTVGDKVYAPGDVLIGRVASVLGKTSKVILFSSPGNQYQVMIGSGHVPATAIGRGGGQYEAEVARDVSVQEGDFVTVPSISNKPFGVVTRVLSDETQPFEVILFAPPVNVYQLRWVMIEKQI